MKAIEKLKIPIKWIGKENYLKINDVSNRIRVWSEFSLETLEKYSRLDNPIRAMGQLDYRKIMLRPIYLNDVIFFNKNKASYGRMVNDKNHCQKFCNLYLINGREAAPASRAIGDSYFYARNESYLYLKSELFKGCEEKFLRDTMQEEKNDYIVTFDYIAKKLKLCLDICVPDGATEKKQIYVNQAISCVQELNKMYGNYKESKNSSSTEYDILNKSNEILAQIIENNKKEY